MHAVDAEIAGSHAPDNGVEVRPVAIEKRAGIVHSLRLFQDLVLEQAAGIRIGQHERGDVVIQRCLERREIDTAPVIERNRLDRVAADRRRRRVSAMRGIRHQHTLAGIAAGFQRRPRGHQAAQFAVRTGGGATWRPPACRSAS